MSCPHCVDSVGIRIWGLRSSQWHSRQANDAVASEGSIFSENQDYKKVFPCRGEHVRTYISGSRCAWWQKTTNRHTNTHIHTHTHTWDNYSNPHCAHAIIGTPIFKRHLPTPLHCVSPHLLQTASTPLLDAIQRIVDISRTQKMSLQNSIWKSCCPLLLAARRKWLPLESVDQVRVRVMVRMRKRFEDLTVLSSSFFFFRITSFFKTSTAFSSARKMSS